MSIDTAALRSRNATRRASEPLEGHGRLAALLVPRKTLAALRQSVPQVTETLHGMMTGVAVYLNEWLPDDSYVERYADGFMRPVVLKRPPKRWWHQKPLRNMRKAAAALDATAAGGE